MIHNLQNDPEVTKAKQRLADFIDRGKTIDLIEKKNTRTTRQNSALHVFFAIISNQLNEMGIDHKHFGLKGQVISTMHTPNIVKEFIWKPIQF